MTAYSGVWRSKDVGVGVTYGRDGTFFGKFDPGARDGFTHSVCSHFHKTEGAALTCARKKRAQYRKEGWK